MKIFRELNAKDTATFKAWAIANYNPSTDIIQGTWHPVITKECLRILTEYLDKCGNEEITPLEGIEE